MKLTGGYLRVMYPVPENCLHLPAWKEFFGFDQHGQEAWFDIEIDEEKYTLQFVPAKDEIPGIPKEIARRQFVRSIEQVERVYKRNTKQSTLHWKMKLDWISIISIQ